MTRSHKRCLLDKLAQDVERIEDQVTRLYGLRAVFRQLAEVFERNPMLSTEWTPLHSFIFGGYTAQACLHIRRLLDRDPQSVSLANVVDDLLANPQLITRDDYVARWPEARVRLPENTPPHVAEIAEEMVAAGVRDLAGKEFDEFASATADGICPERLAERFRSFKQTCEAVASYVNKRLAHCDREALKDPTWGDLDAAIDAVGDIFRHVCLLVTGSALDDFVPVWQGGPWENLPGMPWAEASGEDGVPSPTEP